MRAPKRHSALICLAQMLGALVLLPWLHARVHSHAGPSSKGKTAPAWSHPHELQAEHPHQHELQAEHPHQHELQAEHQHQHELRAEHPHEHQAEHELQAEHPHPHELQAEHPHQHEHEADPFSAEAHRSAAEHSHPEHSHPGDTPGHHGEHSIAHLTAFFLEPAPAALPPVIQHLSLAPMQLPAGRRPAALRWRAHAVRGPPPSALL